MDTRKLLSCRYSERSHYHFSGFIEPWTEKDVLAATPQSQTGITKPVVIFVYSSRIRGGIYLTPYMHLRSAASAALSGESGFINPPGWLEKAIAALICREAGYGESTWRDELLTAELEGLDVTELFNLLKLSGLLGKVDMSEWWLVPTLSSLQIANY